LQKILEDENCFSSIQLNHVGGQGNPTFSGYEPIAPSYYECRPTGFSAREMTSQEITDIRKNFVNSAILAEKSGFEAVEIHLAHGYMLHEFLSEHFNKRKDCYGGSLDYRMRLV
jgi:2,4-dienoyl-CoA reductase-like NADH-dependent reductase (Old Yellow Enzyme family)